MIYAINLTARKNTGFTNIGESIRSDTVTFNIQNLSKDRTYQWFIKPLTTTPDINAIAGDTGTVTTSTLSIEIALPSADFTVGSTYYFALREFDGTASQEVIQVSFTIAQNAVLGQGTSVLNISPLFLPNFTTTERDEIVTGSNALLIYNTTTDQVEEYDPTTDTWGAFGGGAIDSVNGQTGVVVLTKSDIGLANVDNTSDINKPISSATQTALNNKIDLNGQNSTISYLNFTSIVAPAYQEGRVWYDTNFKSLCYWDNFNDIPVKIGQQLTVEARNQTGSTITKGSYVTVTGATGQNPTIALAQANSISTSQIIGIVTANIANNTTGKVISLGLAYGFNTGAFNDGDELYLSATTPGVAVTTPPASPNNVVFLGTVLFANNANGKILFEPLRPLANDNALGTSQIVAPTQNAVKTYADTKLALTGGTITGNTDIVAELQVRSSASLGDENGVILKVEDDGTGDGRLVMLFNNTSSFPTILTATRAVDNTLERLSVNGKISGNEPVASSDLTTKNYVDNKVTGATGTFTSQDGKTITVTNGLITSIV